MHVRRVRALLMGGQACVFYGAAEFSRGTDIAIVADSANLARLRRALADLSAECIAIPELTLRHLRRGHAVQFRCMHPDAYRMRIDVMSRMRGVDDFPELWRRRTTIVLPDGTRCDIMSLPDLLKAKKTQRDKDWPMIRRLIEAHYFGHRGRATAATVNFWLRELRTPALLREVVLQHPRAAARWSPTRAAVAAAARDDSDAIGAALAAEELAERRADREYWRPLIDELAQMRRARK
ncbi:MAG: hypothetical protein FGM37_02690 [Phycisphaerales bacterium]|nr:hypothetical protein [Phycisphaerales bacterium]